jgi:hypothetical protein
MQRRTFDVLMSVAGLVLAGVMFIAAGLLTWGYSFVNNQVHSQLAAQKIFFPPKGSEGLSPAEFPTLQQYAGQQIVTGEQARAYANDFIGAHLKAAGGGQTYAQLSSKALANPTDLKLAAQVQTMFRGETLRGLLLDAYAFWKIGQLALWGAVVAFVGGALMLLLAGLGFWHARKTPPDREFMKSSPEPEKIHS